jgi:hypothetical protein
VAEEYRVAPSGRGGARVPRLVAGPRRRQARERERSMGAAEEEVSGGDGDGGGHWMMTTAGTAMATLRGRFEPC